MISLWYRLGNKRIDSVKTKADMIEWLKNALGITTSITGSRIKYFSIKSGDDSVAHVEWKDGNPGIVFGEGSFNKTPSLDTETHLSVLMGIMFHESMHIKESYKDMEKALGDIGYKGDRTPLLFAIINILEDLYIENKGITTYPYLRWAMSAAWSAYFGVNRIREAEKNQLKSLPTTKEELGYALEIIQCLHNQDHMPKFSGFSAAIADSAIGVLKLHSKELRAQHAVDFYEWITSSLPREEEVAEIPETGSSNYITIDEEEFSTISAGLSEEEAAELKKFVVQGSDEDVETVVKIPKVYEEMSFDSANDSKFAIKEMYISSYSRSKTNVTVAPNWEEVVKVASLLANGKPRANLSKKRGKKFNKLSRIITDSKIFSDGVGGEYRGSKLTTKKPEIIILLDCSGSMSDIINQAGSAALGMAKGFMRAGSKVSVYGHTSLDVGVCNIWRLKEVDDSFSKLQEEMNHVCANGYHLANNADGYAIEHMGKKFGRGGEKQFIVVISDGYPQASGYSGQSAIEHTKQVINSLQKNGVRVISVSIGSHAGQNEKIYGQGNDFPASDPNSASELVKEMLFANA